MAAAGAAGLKALVMDVGPMPPSAFELVQADLPDAGQDKIIAPSWMRGRT